MRTKAEASGAASACRLPLQRLSSPRLSIVICNYNHADYLAAAVESALAQTGAPEVIVVDDGSTDTSLECLQAFLPRIELVKMEHQGQRSAYREGFLRSTGSVVVFLDADDRIFAGAAEAIFAAMGSGVARVHWQLELAAEDGAGLGVLIPNEQSEGFLAARLQRGVFPPSSPGSGNAYRREVLDRLFPLPNNELDRHGADFFLVYGSVFLGDVVALRRPLGAYRLHSTPLASGSSRYFFGNAAKLQDREERLEQRVVQWRRWIQERMGRNLHLPERMLDFSNLKSVFAARVLESGYLLGMVRGLRLCPRLLRSIWYHGEFSGSRKLGLSLWAALLLVAPRGISEPLARHVVDPASRSATPLRF